MLQLIAAIENARGIANEHGIPWAGKIPSDTNYFRKQTESGVILMGYGTYVEFDSPLHDRENFVVTRPDTAPLRPGFTTVSDVTRFFRARASELVWVIGGATLFTQTLPLADQLYLTQLDSDFHCTKFFPNYADMFEMESNQGPYEENNITFHFQIWRRSLNRTEK